MNPEKRCFTRILDFDKKTKQMKENMRPFEILFEVGGRDAKNVKDSYQPIQKSVRNMVKNLDKA